MEKPLVGVISSVVNAVWNGTVAHIGTDGSIGDMSTINTLLDYLAPIRSILYENVNGHAIYESSTAIESQIKERLD